MKLDTLENLVLRTVAECTPPCLVRDICSFLREYQVGPPDVDYALARLEMRGWVRVDGQCVTLTLAGRSGTGAGRFATERQFARGEASRY